MKVALSALAAVFLLASPASAGGSWEGWGDGWSWGSRPYYDSGYYWAPRPYWRRGYRRVYGPPAFVPRLYAVPYGYPVPIYGRYRSYYNDGDCEVVRKWRRGRFYEKIDCD